MGEWIDEIARAMAGGATRRTALRRIGGGLAAVGLTFLLPKQAEADDVPGNPGPCAPPKVGVCHNTGSASNPVVFICVDADAVPAHVKNHGDGFPGDVNNCPTCGIPCPAPPANATEHCTNGRCGFTCN